jgi:hypothetical protein
MDTGGSVQEETEPKDPVAAPSEVVLALNVVNSVWGGTSTTCWFPCAVFVYSMSAASKVSKTCVPRNFEI